MIRWPRHGLRRSSAKGRSCPSSMLPKRAFTPVFAGLKHLARLPDPEVIHRRKSLRVLALEGVPAIDIGQRSRVRKAAAEALQRPGIGLEAEEFEAVPAHEVRDLRQAQAMLASVEEQVTAAAGAEEVRRRQKIAER